MQKPTFKSLYADLIKKASPSFHPGNGQCHSSGGKICAACHASGIDYDAERKLKNVALQNYWTSSIAAKVPLLPLVPSPLGRRYRSVSKRKVLRSKNGYSLVLLSPDEDGSVAALEVTDCLIEPVAHNAIYTMVRENLNRPALTQLGNALNYVIVKGSSQEQTVILNLRSLDAAVVKAANGLSRALTRRVDSVKSVLLFEGEGDDRFYMGAKRPTAQMRVRKLFGKDLMHERVLEKVFLYGPLSFTQVNPSIVPQLAQKMREQLELSGNDTLYDFYCGYGLFAVLFAPSVRNAVGVEWNVASIADARKNAERNAASNVRFIHAAIDAGSIVKVVERSRAHDIAILDPPRNGTAPGVIEILAGRRLRRVAHLFCNIELASLELQRWEKSGYRLDSAEPFDMFPGTDSVEVLAMLAPAG